MREVIDAEGELKPLAGQLTLRPTDAGIVDETRIAIANLLADFGGQPSPIRAWIR